MREKSYLKQAILISIFVLIFILIVFISNTDGNKRRKVTKAIKYSGFVLDKDGILYTKKLEDKQDLTKDLYFDIYSYQLIENYYERIDGVESYLNVTYGYSDESLVYNFSVKYEDTEFSFFGEDTDNGLTCEKVTEFKGDIDNKSIYCGYAKKLIDDFSATRLQTITSSKILKYMRKK